MKHIVRVRRGRVLVDRGELPLPFFVEVEVEMTDFFQIAFRATLRMLPERVQAQIDVGTMRVLVAQPGLEFWAGDLLGCSDSLHRVPRLTIANNYCQPIRGFKVPLDVAPG